MSQCCSCGGDCGGTKATGCQYANASPAGVAGLADLGRNALEVIVVKDAEIALEEQRVADLMAQVQEQGLEIAHLAEHLDLFRKNSTPAFDRQLRDQKEIARLNTELTRITCADTESPEYWRGHDAGVAGITNRWEEALTKPIPKPGVMGSERLEGLYRRTERLREALRLWNIAFNNSEESELDDMACQCVPMPLFCDADEATAAALKGE